MTNSEGLGLNQHCKYNIYFCFSIKIEKARTFVKYLRNCTRWWLKRPLFLEFFQFFAKHYNRKQKNSKHNYIIIFFTLSRRQRKKNVIVNYLSDFDENQSLLSCENKHFRMSISSMNFKGKLIKLYFNMLSNWFEVLLFKVFTRWKWQWI